MMVKWRNITKAIKNGTVAWKSKDECWVIYRHCNSDGNTLFYVNLNGVFYCMTSTFDTAKSLCDLYEKYGTVELK